MKYDVETLAEYLESIPQERKEVMTKLMQIIWENLPPGFEEVYSYNMIGYVVPHSKYPKGYHVDPSLPLPFIHLASQKNFIALYHSGIYADPQLNDWFQKKYKEEVSTKLDMGKSCVRFKNPKNIPFDLIGELCQKISPDQWIKKYESAINV